jgi:hypothetical protein
MLIQLSVGKLGAVHCYLVPFLQLSAQERTRPVASLTNTCFCEVLKQLNNTMAK